MKARNKIYKWKRGLTRTASAFLLSAWTLAPVYASDTEVYSREVIVTGEGAPTLMMVLDTSANMNKCMGDETDCTGTPDSRIQTMGRAVSKVLFGNNGLDGNAVIKPAPDFLKLGYVRFRPENNKGGWLRYGADKNLGDTLITQASDFANVTVTVRIPNAASDAKQTNSSTTDAIDNSADAGDDLIIDNNANTAVGLRFDEVFVPKGAVINSATLHFVQRATGGNPAPNLIVLPEQSGDAADFASATAGIEDRSYATGSGQYDVVGYGTSGVSVKNSIQYIVNQAGWCGGNALGLKLYTSTNKTRTIGSYENAAGDASKIPTLRINYTLPTSVTAPGTGSISSTCLNVYRDIVKSVIDGLDDVEWTSAAGSPIEYGDTALNPAAEPDSASNVVAVRFQNLPLLRNAEIKSAWLYTTGFTQDGVTGPATNVQVYGFKPAGNLPAFCTRDTTTNTVSCPFNKSTPLTVASDTDTAPLDPAIGALESSLLALPTVTSEDVNHVVNLKLVVQEIVNDANWNSDNEMGFYLAKKVGSPASPVALSSMDAGASRAMVLHVAAVQPYTNLTNLIKTVRQDIYEYINGRIFAAGHVSLGASYQEAARYMLGIELTVPGSTIPDVFTFDSNFSGAIEADESYQHPKAGTYNTTTTKYISPVSTTAECSANYIFMMGDGIPDDASGVGNNSNFVVANGGTTYPANPSCNAYPTSSTGNANANFSCIQAVAYHLATGNNQKGKKIRTNTVYFGPPLATGSELESDMRRVADKGAGTFYQANDEQTLMRAILDTLRALIDVSGTITAPGVAVNQFNRLTHLDQLYYSVFDPDTKRARWLGNVKRYRLAFFNRANSDGTTSETAQIVDVNGANAIDDTTSFFSTTSKSYWSPLVDGDKAALGGVAAKLPAPANRVIWTNVDGTSTTALQDLRTLTAANLTSASTITGLNAVQFNNLRNWILGYKIDIVDTTATPNVIKSSAVTTSSTTLLRNQVGGVLHSQPVLVNYGYSGSDPTAAATDPSLQDNTVFFSDMEGLLHAVNTSTGVETFAFMPRETLMRYDEVAINPVQVLPEFGLDLTWTVYRKDANNDYRITTGSSGDKVWLFGGMRMGGRNYYAIDATDRGAPTLKWVIQGGSTGPFANLGQTWSKPVLANVKIGGVEKTVMFFGGGYDPKHETAGFSSTANAIDSQGNQIYIIDPDTGAVLWWASNEAAASLTVPDMKFSIPTELKVVDSDNDNYVDAIYFGDLGGQVWRVDLDNANSSAAGLGVRAKLLANLGQGVVADTANQRRFYEPPSVARQSNTSGNPYLSVALGSGYRSHPLNYSTQDYFYVLKDTDALRTDRLSPPASTPLQATITPSDLATVDLTSSAGTDTSSTMGWKLALPATGEKVLGYALSLFGEVIFTSYVPDLTATTSCQPVIGQSNLYRMRLLDAAAVDTNGDGTIDSRSLPGLVHGMAGPPQVIVGGGSDSDGSKGENAIVTGTGVVRNRNLGGATARLRWYEKTKTPGATATSGGTTSGGTTSGGTTSGGTTSGGQTSGGTTTP
ncbi:MAG: hypothetical protein K0R03_879 [Moraxellaceae bacterium]|jgi:type IV pilus assembly protein PilY1|nr:hypothetical protein [Moraxellaceae bacterium]